MMSLWFPPLRGDRVSPGILHPRRVHLSRLRELMLRAFSQVVRPGENQLLVDVGCGSMPYRSLIEDQVGGYLGDLTANPQADRAVGQDGCLPFEDCSVDIVLSSQVLEHVENVASHLAEIRRILRPEGRLVLSTHGFWSYHPDPIDLRRWTADGLRTELAQAGLKCTDLAGDVDLLSVALQLGQDALTPHLGRLGRPALFFAFQNLMSLAGKLGGNKSDSQHALAFVVVAQPDAAKKKGTPQTDTQRGAEGEGR